MSSDEREQRRLRESCTREIWGLRIVVRHALHREERPTNRKRLALLGSISLSVLVALATPGARAQSGPFVYVPNGQSVSAIDTPTNTIVLFGPLHRVKLDGDDLFTSSQETADAEGLCRIRADLDFEALRSAANLFSDPALKVENEGSSSLIPIS